jgi:hypothetical protein
MTVLTEPTTGEIRRPATTDLPPDPARPRGEHARTLTVRVPVARPADLDGPTRRLKPPTVLVPLIPRRPPIDPTGPLYRRDADGPATIGVIPPPLAATQPVGHGCRQVRLDPEDLVRPGQPRPPRPLPTPPPAPKTTDDQADGNVGAWTWDGGNPRWAGPRTPGHVAQHRRPSLLARLTGKRGTR